jgi:tRNA A37 threonylcarbamoyladenosine dehydratase
VVNGDLSCVAEPILVGHYASARLSGTEALLDARLGGAMARAVVVVGLGEEGSLAGAALAMR